MESFALVSGKEAAGFIASKKEHLPGCVKQVLLRADVESLVGEAKRVELVMIPSAKFKDNFINLVQELPRLAPEVLRPRFGGRSWPFPLRYRRPSWDFLDLMVILKTILRLFR